MTNKTQIINIPIDNLIKADWNYKSEGTPEQIAKLCESIKKDESAGVLAVREMPDNKFEVIDGNHRLDAVKIAGWKKVSCENFGKISKAKAIIIARRRNHKWFEDDTLKFAELFRDYVLKETTIEELEKYMPDSREELENLSKLLDFDWSQFENRAKEQGNQEFENEIKLRVSPETYQIWLDWCERAKNFLGYDNPSKAFEFAIVEAINIPEESFNEGTIKAREENKPRKKTRKNFLQIHTSP